MGAHTFETVTMTTESYETAYRRLCSEAVNEYGHNGYNGSISTTEGVRLVNVAPMTLAQAGKVAGPHLDGMGKWEACEVIPLVAETDAEYEQTGTQMVTLTLTGANYTDKAKRHAAIAKALGIKVDQIDRVTEQNRQITIRTRSVPTQGKAVTKYFALAANSDLMPKWESGFASQADARAALNTETVKDVPTYADYEVIAITRREDGAGLLTAERRVTKGTVTYAVKTRRLIKKATVGTERAGWYFFGWAAS